MVLVLGLAKFTGSFAIITHIFWVSGCNLGYFTWGCKCSCGLFWKAWPCGL